MSEQIFITLLTGMIGLFSITFAYVWRKNGGEGITKDAAVMGREKIFDRLREVEIKVSSLEKADQTMNVSLSDLKKEVMRGNQILEEVRLILAKNGMNG